MKPLLMSVALLLLPLSLLADDTPPADIQAYLNPTQTVSVKPLPPVILVPGSLG